MTPRVFIRLLLYLYAVSYTVSRLFVAPIPHSNTAAIPVAFIPPLLYIYGYNMAYCNAPHRKTHISTTLEERCSVVSSLSAAGNHHVQHTLRIVNGPQ